MVELIQKISFDTFLLILLRYIRGIIYSGFPKETLKLKFRAHLFSSFSHKSSQRLAHGKQQLL